MKTKLQLRAENTFAERHDTPEGEAELRRKFDECVNDPGERYAKLVRLTFTPDRRRPEVTVLLSHNR